MTRTVSSVTIQEHVSPGEIHPDADHPYLGLRPFTEPDSDYFFGRDHDTKELYRLIKRHVLTVLFGASGLGKSSLLNAGLFPMLRKSSYLPIRIELRLPVKEQLPLEQVIACISNAVMTRCVDTPPPDPGEALWEYFHRTHFWNKVNNQLLTPILVFDQFEEVTRYAHDKDVKDILRDLADLIENRIPASVQTRLAKTREELAFDYDIPKAKVIISLREDFLAELEDLSKLMPSLSENRYRLTQMNGEQALQAVIKPAEHGDLVSGEVAEQIVRFVASAGKTEKESVRDSAAVLADLRVEPSLLSLVCDELNRRRIAQRLATITADLLQLSQERILSDFYEDSLHDCDVRVREFVEDRLLTKTGFRTSLALDDALKEGVDERDIQKLVQRRILRLDEHLGRRHVELMHDRLTGVVEESRTLRQEKKRQREEQQRREESHRREQAAQEKRWRRRLRVTSYGVLAGLFLAGIAAVSWYFTDLLRTQSEAGRLVGQAEGLLSKTHPESYVQSLLLAAESLKLAETPAGSAVWAKAMAALPPQNVALTHDKALNAAVFDSSDRLITGNGNNVTWWELSKGKPISAAKEREKAHDIGLTIQAFSPDGQHLAGIDPNGTVWVLLSTTGEVIAQLKHKESPVVVAFSSSSRYLASGSLDNRARIWAVERGDEPTELRHEGWVTSLSFSSDEKYLVTGSDDGYARVWEVETGDEVGRFPHDGATVLSVAMSADGKYLATGTGNDHGMLRIWEWNTGAAEPHALRRYKESVWSVAFDPSGEQLAMLSGDWLRIKRIDLRHEVMRLPLGLERTGKTALASFAANGQRLVTIKGDTARVWEIAEYRHPLNPLDYGSSIAKPELSADGKYLAAASSDNGIRLWNVNTRKLEKLLEHPGRVTALSFSADGARLATASLDKTVRVWDITTGQELNRFHYDVFVTSVNFGPDGKRLALASGDTAVVLDMEIKQEPIPLFHNMLVTAVIFHPKDSNRLATTSGDTALIWDLQTKKELQRIAHKQPVSAVSFNAKGDVLATASGDLVTTWSADSGLSITTLPHTKRVLDLQFSKDGKKFATLGYDDTGIIWDAASYEPLFRFPHEHSVVAGVFSHDGKQFVSATASGRNAIWFWPLNATAMIEQACSVLPRDLSPNEWRTYFPNEKQRPICE